MTRKSQFCTLNLSPRTGPAEPAVCPTRKRLAEAFAYLEKIERQRACGRASLFARFMEQRIIWRELLELELQDADEQIERISAAAALGGAS